MPAPIKGMLFRSRKKQTETNTLLNPIRMNTGSSISNRRAPRSAASKITYGPAKIQTARKSMNNPSGR